MSFITEWNFDTDTVTEDITLYAKWIKVYTVTYNANGHGTAPASENVEEGYTALHSFGSLYASGYIFKGWYREEECITEWRFGTDTVTEDITLYAKWIEGYMVKFDTNGHGSYLEPKGVKSGEKVPRPLEAFVSTGVSGYILEGWYREKECITEWNFDTDTVTEDITLYAKWIESCKVTFDSNGREVCFASEEVRKGEKISRPVDFPAAGYNVTGWYREKECITLWNFTEDTVTEDITLYAYWVPNIYKVFFDSNGGKGKLTEGMIHCIYDQEVLLMSKGCKKLYYDFAGWSEYSDGSGKVYQNGEHIKNLTDINEGTVILYAQWVPKPGKYHITYILDDDAVNDWNPVYYSKNWATIKLAKPTKEGYTFAGWYKDSKLKKKVTKIAKGSKGDRTFYAKWTANKYNVKFNSNGGTGGKMSVLKNKVYGKAFNLPVNKFKKKGYKFVGWNTKKDGTGTRYDDQQSVMNLTAKAKKTVTLYAQWEEE